ncbi:PmoA family protein [Aestuariibaculum sp. M13]|uniref:PmoA family protein n=1 Tax=Aestuariibaculum sp. M13 TaxID=2967132 RepID=UPI002159F580|nr:PmoA family protein [Aestuariibaculum sp. M13]MCR8668793.1 PmoA family protein [Aestuariibaculum sp. M13]
MSAEAQSVSVEINKDQAYFTEDNDSILVYQITEKSQNGNYKRANYIHPLYSLDGEILTKDFPEDHLHHRGIFWAWHQLYIGNKRIGDGWEIENFKWDVTSVKEIENHNISKTIQAEVYWKSNLWLDSTGNEKPFVKEITTITVYPKTENYRAIDIEIHLLALEPDMRIGGSEDEKGYGGFSSRIKLPEDINFTSCKGKVTPENLPVKAANWMDITGALGKNSSQAGLTIFCHPSNPGKQNRWILRQKRSMQNAVYPFSGAKTVALSNNKPTILRYRLLIHNGDPNTLNLPKIYKGYKKAY